MSRATIASCLLVALGAAGCAADESDEPAGSTAAWQRPAACAAGSPGCLEAVVAEMRRRFAPLADDCDHDAPFALMYLRVTEAVHRAESTFADRAYLAQLDSVFARYYFDAFDHWRNGRTSSVPEAWAVAFQLAGRGRVTAAGNLLLGMNAHISRDLPFAVAELGFPAGSRAVRQRSFAQVNRVLSAVAGPMLREQALRFDPTIATFTLPVLTANEDTLGLVLARWRDDALRDAGRLLRAPTDERRQAVARSIEQAAASRAAVIAAATSRVPFSEAGRARDAFCRSRTGA